MELGKRQITLAAMASGSQKANFNPVQIQKLLFLVDRELSDLVNGPFFDFQPDRYGPSDGSVYVVLDRLEAENKIQTDSSGPYIRYCLQDSGFEEGTEILKGLSKVATACLAEAAYLVCHLSVEQLLTAINERYPEMAVGNAAFGVALIEAESRRRRAITSYVRRTTGQSFLAGFTHFADLAAGHGSNYKLLQDYLAAGSTDVLVKDAWTAVGESLRKAIEGHRQELERQ